MNGNIEAPKIRVFKLNFRNLVYKQSLLNEFINKKNKNKKPWFNTRTVNDFINAIIDEVSELLNSFPWKWWKKNGHTQPNFRNILVEFSDILHFTLSYDFLVAKKYLVSVEGRSEDELTYNEILELIPEEAPVYYIYSKYDRENPDYTGYYSTIHMLLLYILQSKLKLSVLPEKKKDLVDLFITIPVFVAAPKFNITPKLLIDVYNLKYQLNKIRQKYGYNKGTYPKIIDGKEDNEVLLDLYFSKKSVYGAITEFEKILKSYSSKK
jgi:hypothetical protein